MDIDGALRSALVSLRAAEGMTEGQVVSAVGREALDDWEYLLFKIGQTIEDIRAEMAWHEKYCATNVNNE